MADTFSLKLVTPIGVLFEGDAVGVTAHGPLGEFGVLAQHVNFITSLVPGVLRIDLPDGSKRYWVVSGGLAEVKDGAMTLLAQGAEAPEALDASAAEAQERDAERRLAEISFYDLEFPQVEESLLLNRARREAASRPN